MHHVIAEHGGVEVRARLMHSVAPRPQSRIRLRFPASRRLLFDQAGRRLSA